MTLSEPGACSSSRVGLQHLLLLFIRLFSSLRQFRLKRCGLHKPIYLVEECGSAASHLSLPETTLQQAIVNTQVECTLGATWVTLKLKQMLWCPAGRSHQKMVRCGTCVASLPYQVPRKYPHTVTSSARNFGEKDPCFPVVYFNFLSFHLKVAAEIERRQTSRAGVASEPTSDSRSIFCLIFVSLPIFEFH